MKRILVIVAIAFSFVLSSCNSGEEVGRTKKVELEIQLFTKTNSNSNKYPTEISKICDVIKASCNDTNFAFTPLIFTRVDLNNKFKIDLLEGKEGNATINFIRIQNNHFFSDSVMNKILTEPTNTSYSFIDFSSNLKEKKNYFVYSTNEDLKIDSITVYHSEDDLRKAISQALCINNFSKIVVLYEPSTNGDSPPPPQACSDLQQLLIKIATSANYAERTKAKDDAVRMFFADKFSVTLKNEHGDIVDEYEMGGEYLDKLVADFHIIDFRIVNCQKNQDKITHIDVVEKRKNDVDVKAE